MFIGSAAIATVFSTAAYGVAQPDAGRAYLKLSAGVFDLVDDENTASDVALEYYPTLRWWRVRPLLGVGLNTDGSAYGWMAASLNLHLADPFIFGVSTGPAFYRAGSEGKDLGSSGLLRSGLEIGVRLPNTARLTASLHHMSHGGLMNPGKNPGAEVVSLNLVWPMN